MSIGSNRLVLDFGVRFEDLYQRDGLVRLDSVFLGYLKDADSALHACLIAARENPSATAPKDYSTLIIDVAPHLEDFIGQLFSIASEIRDLQARHHELAPLYSVKRRFVQRSALIAKIPADQAAAFNGDSLQAELETRS